MRKIVASNLNKSIDIYDFIKNLKEDGSQNLEYIYFSSVFASIRPIEGAYLSFKYSDIKQLFENSLYIFTIRAGIVLKNNMIIKYRDSFFDIKKIIEDDQIIKLITSKIQERNVTSKIKSSNI